MILNTGLDGLQELYVPQSLERNTYSNDILNFYVAAGQPEGKTKPLNRATLNLSMGEDFTDDIDLSDDPLIDAVRDELSEQLEDIDEDELDDVSPEDIQNVVEESVEGSIEELATDTYERILSNDEGLERYHETIEGFQEGLEERWGEPLELLERLLSGQWNAAGQSTRITDSKPGETRITSFKPSYTYTPAQSKSVLKSTTCSKEVSRTEPSPAGDHSTNFPSPPHSSSTTAMKPQNASSVIITSGNTTSLRPTESTKITSTSNHWNPKSSKNSRK